LYSRQKGSDHLKKKNKLYQKKKKKKRKEKKKYIDTSLVCYLDCSSEKGRLQVEFSRKSIMLVA